MGLDKQEQVLGAGLWETCDGGDGRNVWKAQEVDSGEWEVLGRALRASVRLLLGHRLQASKAQCSQTHAEKAVVDFHFSRKACNEPPAAPLPQ